MASDKQKELFAKLLGEKQLPAGQDPEALKTQFNDLSTGAGSEWIEKLLTLPDKGAVPPPF